MAFLFFFCFTFYGHKMSVNLTTDRPTDRASDRFYCLKTYFTAFARRDAVVVAGSLVSAHFARDERFTATANATA